MPSGPSPSAWSGQGYGNWVRVRVRVGGRVGIRVRARGGVRAGIGGRLGLGLARARAS